MLVSNVLWIAYAKGIGPVKLNYDCVSKNSGAPLDLPNAGSKIISLPVVTG